MVNCIPLLGRERGGAMREGVKVWRNVNSKSIAWIKMDVALFFVSQKKPTPMRSYFVYPPIIYPPFMSLERVCIQGSSLKVFVFVPRLFHYNVE